MPHELILHHALELSMICASSSPDGSSVLMNPAPDMQHFAHHVHYVCKIMCVIRVVVNVNY